MRQRNDEVQEEQHLFELWRVFTFMSFFFSKQERREEKRRERWAYLLLYKTIDAAGLRTPGACSHTPGSKFYTERWR